VSKVVVRCVKSRNSPLIGVLLFGFLPVPYLGFGHGWYLAALHAQLDADELVAAWAQGRVMTFEQAVEYALETD
jgi:hypothetical protein